MKHAALYLSLMMVVPILLMSEVGAEVPLANVTQQEKPMYEFNNADEIDSWLIVNDGVMGGLSTSEIVLSDNNTAIFKGAVSLENNGGFASTRTISRSYGLKGYDGVKLRVRGDGKNYQFRARTDDRFDGVSYRYSFDTTPNEWMIIEIPFELCEPVFRGRVLEGVKPLVSEEIQQLGFLITIKKADNFQLEIDWIKAYKN